MYKFRMVNLSTSNVKFNNRHKTGALVDKSGLTMPKILGQN